ncbi:hypothetical protein ACIRON_18705 [Nocardioides sp. NPDC101246]|uniref:hypothetical protein n=1 Tax=Nocardioides sp. NPDC101246 TaxID=3364336 RepID=UPI00381039C7
MPTRTIRPASTSPLVSAAELVARVAVLIPMPSAALGRDETAWSGFEALVSDASELLAARLGRDTLRALTTARVGEDPLCLLLLEQALDNAG